MNRNPWDEPITSEELADQAFRMCVDSLQKSIKTTIAKIDVAMESLERFRAAIEDEK